MPHVFLPCPLATNASLNSFEVTNAGAEEKQQ